MIQLRHVLILSTVLLVACQDENTHLDKPANTQILMESKIIESKRNVSVPILRSKIDQVALKQIGQYQEEKISSVFELYDQSVDEVEAWSDKLWGRCCTEADMRFTEFLGFNIYTSKENSEYPFSNALDNLFATSFVFQETDNVAFTVNFDGDTDMYGRLKDQTANDIVSDKDTIQSYFEMSIVNGYTKSAKTFKENSRIKTVEVWLNGKLKNRCKLLDTPKVQVVKGNFPFFKTDTVQIVPIDYYPGDVYKDVCISAFQLSLGYGAHQNLDRLSKYWNY